MLPSVSSHGYVLFTFLSMLALIFLCESVPRKASHVMNTFCHVLTYEHPFRFLSFWAGPIEYLNRFLLWPWPRICKVTYLIYYISAKNDLIVTIQETNILIECWASNVAINFYLSHDLGPEFSRSNICLDYDLGLCNSDHMSEMGGWLPQKTKKKKEIYRLNASHQAWAEYNWCLPGWLQLSACHRLV